MEINKIPILYDNHKNNNFICLLHWLDTKLKITNSTEDEISCYELYEFIIINFYNNRYNGNIKNPHLWTCLGSMAAAQAVIIILYSAIFRCCLQDSNPNETPPYRRAAIVHGCPFDTHGPCQASCPAHGTWTAL